MKSLTRSLIAICIAFGLSAPVLAADEAQSTTTEMQTTQAATETQDQQAVAEQVNINTADAKTIATTLKGIGMKKAEAIVSYREKNGPFKSVDDVTSVKGISKKWLEKNRDKITVG